MILKFFSARYKFNHEIKEKKRQIEKKRNNIKIIETKSNIPKRKIKKYFKYLLKQKIFNKNLIKNAHFKVS